MPRPGEKATLQQINGWPGLPLCTITTAAGTPADNGANVIPSGAVVLVVALAAGKIQGVASGSYGDASAIPLQQNERLVLVAPNIGLSSSPNKLTWNPTTGTQSLLVFILS